MHTISIKVPFCAAHRVFGHEGRCKHLHGHNYLATIVIASVGRTEIQKVKVKKGTKEEKVNIPAQLNELGMVIDFSTIKELVKVWIDENWDHNTILGDGDPLAKYLLSKAPKKSTEAAAIKEIANSRDAYVMTGRNATAEHLAEELCEKVVEMLLEEVTVSVQSVTIEETDGCAATFIPDSNGGDDAGGDEEGDDGEETEEEDEEEESEEEEDDGDDEEEDEEEEDGDDEEEEEEEEDGDDEEDDDGDDEEDDEEEEEEKVIEDDDEEEIEVKGRLRRR